jgi:UDP-N-acetylmuramyl pentapeptide phosphotransferase/UDP-N-acetylglucosamine-1-phosphate transferase
MLEISITAGVSFIIAFLAIPVVILVADKKKLYDIPDERKTHTHAISSLGGIGIFLGVLFSCLLTFNIQAYPEFQYFLAAIFLIFFIGLKDDLVSLSATKKFIAQIIAAAIIIHLGGIKIENFYGVFEINELEPMISIPFTYVTIILIMNAFNLIDGIDGLAGSLGLMSSLMLGVYFYFSGLPIYAAFSFSLSAALCAFLIFNYQPSRIFMGDSGSLVLGLICSILVLKFINVATSPTAVIPVFSAVAMGMVVIIIPVTDTIRVFAVRMIRGRSPFSPDRNHIHHLLVDRGLSHSMATFLCVTFNVILIMGTYLFRFLGNTVLIVSLFVICNTVLGYLYFTLPKRKMVIHRGYLLNRERRRRANIRSKTISLNSQSDIRAENMNH